MSEPENITSYLVSATRLQFDNSVQIYSFRAYIGVFWTGIGHLVGDQPVSSDARLYQVVYESRAVNRVALRAPILNIE